MKIADLHPHETERLAALEELAILDTFPESEFDEIVFIASQICGAPIALVSLIDDKRQWFKSKIGISTQETPKDYAFCAHAILQDELFIVKNATEDERFHDNPLVTGSPLIRFYAGVPLHSPTSKLPIGTICIIDTKPRDLSESQKKSLKALSSQIDKLLELRSQNIALTRAKEKLTLQNTAFENLADGIVIHDKFGSIIDFNSSALNCLGLSASELKGKTSLDPQWKVIKEDGSDYPGHEHPASIAFKTGQIHKNEVMGVYREFKQNDIVWLNVNAVPLFLDGAETPSHVVATFSDITEQKQYTNALVQNTKMASLGFMAGGIAHEINTPLAIINTTAELIRINVERQQPIEQLLKLVNRIEDTVKRVSKIVSGLKSFARNSENDPIEAVQFSKIVTDCLIICSEKFKFHSIEIITDFSGDTQVKCVSNQISQIVLNLLNNSFDAIAELENKWIKIKLSNDENTAFLHITDSGNGIDPKVQSRLMEPFFTTKDVGKGSGLGLSISVGIAKKFNGDLRYDPSQSHTTFVLELPVCKTEA